MEKVIINKEDIVHAYEFIQVCMTDKADPEWDKKPYFIMGQLIKKLFPLAFIK